MVKLEKIIELLKTKKLTIAAVESCSGGYLSYLLTKIPGSSKAFKGSIIAYSLEAKHIFFKIPLPLLEKTQGVSASVALLLAQRVKKLFKSDIGVSVVGFAGPDAKKGIKAGTVFIAVSNKDGNKAKKIIIKGSRDAVRKKTSLLLIDLIYRTLNSKSEARNPKQFSNE